MEENTNLPSVAVVDASFLLAFLLPDEKFAYADMVIDASIEKKIQLLSSPLLPYEIINALRSAVMQKRVEKTNYESILNDFLKLHIPLVSVDFTKLLSYALDNNITVYDASYLMLAKTQHTPLLTLDKTLNKIASSF